VRLLEGKKALVFGVANDKSIGWGISQALAAHGAQLGLAYLDERMEKRVRPLAESVDAGLFLPCDVQYPEQVEAVFREVETRWGQLDILVHSLAFAPREDLQGRFSQTSKEGFLKALEISAYSLVELTRHAHPLLRSSEGCVLTLSYLGAERVVPNYNVMGVAKAALEASVRYLAADLGPDGIRVNAISAGPIRTLAAAGVKGFKDLLPKFAQNAPLRRNMDLKDIGNAALFLCSELGSGVTGEVVYVDGGNHLLASSPEGS
jgi:enoyl-[acyl-carrier protein] reductase I